MTERLPRSAVDRLGKRLRAVEGVEAITPEDRAMLNRLRSEHADALDVVAAALRDDLSLQPTIRVKTVNTLVEKLQRERSMSLRSMQDVAGARVVIDGGRQDQDVVVDRIAERFTDSAPKVVDRRVHPTHGYRAVHVVVREAGCLVEIQVRTALQDLWAQVVERLADVYGRQIRYGEVPLDPGSGTRPARHDAQRLVQEAATLADIIDVVERMGTRREQEDVVEALGELEAVLYRGLQRIRDAAAALAAPTARRQDA